MTIKALRKIIKEEIRQLTEESDRGKQVKEMVRLSVKFDPPLMFTDDKLVDALYSEWLSSGRQPNVTIKYTADHRMSKIKSIEIK